MSHSYVVYSEIGAIQSPCSKKHVIRRHLIYVHPAVSFPLCTLPASWSKDETGKRRNFENEIPPKADRDPVEKLEM